MRTSLRCQLGRRWAERGRAPDEFLYVTQLGGFGPSRTLEGLLPVLACAKCGGRLHVVGTVTAPAAARAILERLGLTSDVPPTVRARDPTADDANGDTFLASEPSLLMPIVHSRRAPFDRVTTTAAPSMAASRISA
jgi:hypothetical protein